MNALAGVPVALAALAALGCGLARHEAFAGPAWARRGTLAIAWGFVLGTAAAGVALAALTATVGFVVWPVYVLIAIAWGAPATACAPGEAPPPRTAASDLAAIALVALLCVVTAERVGSDVGWDGWAVWSIKARAIHHEDTLATGVARDLSRFGFSHPDYPPLMPLLEVWVWRHCGEADERLVGLLHAAWLWTVAGLATGLARRRAAWWSALLPLLVVATSTVWQGVAAGQADVPLLSFNLAALALLSAPGPAGPALALVLAGALLTKNEGAVSAAAAGVAVLAAGPGRARSAAWLAAAVAATAPWLAVKARLGLVVDHVARGLAPAADWPGRFAALLAALAGRATGLPGPAPLIAATLARLALDTPARGAALAFGLLLAPGLMAAYVLARMEQSFMMATSIDRVLCQALPVLLLAPPPPER